MQVAVADDHELTFIGAAAGTLSIHVIAGIYRQPCGIGILVPVYEGRPPGNPTFFVVSTTGGRIAPDRTAVHDLKFAGGLSPLATRSSDPCDNQGQHRQGD
jgi:hypothetical protein